jgi:hypothetical protein
MAGGRERQKRFDPQISQINTDFKNPKAEHRIPLDSCFQICVYLCNLWINTPELKTLPAEFSFPVRAAVR